MRGTGVASVGTVRVSATAVVVALTTLAACDEPDAPASRACYEGPGLGLTMRSGFGARSRVAASIAITIVLAGAAGCGPCESSTSPARTSNNMGAMPPAPSDALRRITARVTRHGDPNDEATPRPLLTLEEFFEGNDEGMIASNLPDAPPSDELYAMLRAVRARPGVLDLRVQITMFDDTDIWPYSDTVWVITTASPDEVRSWFPPRIAPDEVFAGWLPDVRYEPLTIPEGASAIGCWWD